MFRPNFQANNESGLNVNKFKHKKGNLECTFCHGTNYTHNRCFHLIGFPLRNKSMPPNRFNKFVSTSKNQVVAHVTTNTTDEETPSTNYVQAM